MPNLVHSLQLADTLDGSGHVLSSSDFPFKSIVISAAGPMAPALLGALLTFMGLTRKALSMLLVWQGRVWLWSAGFRRVGLQTLAGLMHAWRSVSGLRFFDHWLCTGTGNDQISGGADAGPDHHHRHGSGSDSKPLSM